MWEPCRKGWSPVLCGSPCRKGWSPMLRGSPCRKGWLLCYQRSSLIFSPAINIYGRPSLALLEQQPLSLLPARLCPLRLCSLCLQAAAGGFPPGVSFLQAQRLSDIRWGVCSGALSARGRQPGSPVGSPGRCQLSASCEPARCRGAPRHCHRDRERGRGGLWGPVHRVTASCTLRATVAEIGRKRWLARHHQEVNSAHEGVGGAKARQLLPDGDTT